MIIEISVTVFKRCDTRQIAAIKVRLEECCYAAFKKAYEGVWSPEREAATRKIFPTHFNRFNNSDDYTLVLAMHADNILGWMIFKPEIDRVLLEALCVDPVYWGRGVGKKLILLIKNRFVPNVKKISLITRKINGVASSFYEHLGFIKSNFMLAEYNANEYQGYEWQCVVDHGLNEY